jgi:hypothetical protein
MTEFIPEELDRYFYWLHERENIRILKEEQGAEPPWTKDPILQKFKFCQVFREDDRTTRWFRTHIREPLQDEAAVIMATIIFRWFNFIETGRTLLKHDLLLNWDRKKAIEEITKQPKWVTGSYIIKTPNRMDKVTGVAECITHMWKDRNYIAETLELYRNERKNTLKSTWELFKDYPYMGPFMAYEVVTDLRDTYILEDASDVNTWANAGPGAMRGLNRLTGRALKFTSTVHPWQKEMYELWEIATTERLDGFIIDHEKFELREIEGGLCEFDKYSRILKNEGRTRGLYKYNKELPLVEDTINGESIWAE